MGKGKLNKFGSIAIHLLLAISLGLGLTLALRPAEPVQAASSATAVSVGSNFACALTDGGGIKCWGVNSFGQLGNSTNIDSNIPVTVSGLASGASAISAGYYHACALVNGGVKCWGWNNYGQLGNGTNTNSNVPVDVNGLTSGVIAIDAGYYHTCALTAGGGVKCWGRNIFGQLGDSSNVDSNLPMDVTGLTSDVSQIDSGGTHTCALTTGGGAKCWGQNTHGQLGDGSIINSNTPVDVTGLASGVTVVKAGGVHACAILNSGGLKCWGTNTDGQLGNSVNTDSDIPVDVTGLTAGVSAATAGYYSTCAITTSGGIKCWGNNSEGQLGNGTNINSNLPVDVTGLTSGIVAVSAAYFHTCAVTSSGGIKCWGKNSDGELGNGTNIDSNVPVDVSGITGNLDFISTISAGGYFSCALTGGGGIKCWGLNIHGQLGDGSNIDSNLPVDVTGLAGGANAISAGYEHACALVNGGVKCWGRNLFGELGNGTNTNSNVPVDVTGLTSGVIAVDAGVSFTCALTSGGGVKCWGRNNEGMLGNGTITDSNVPVDVTGLTSGVSQIDSGGIHACALTSGGGVKCWGRNFAGQLGNGNTIQSNVPVDVLGLASGITVVSTGGNHTCALTTGDGLKCWGLNFYGQLGNGTNSNSNVPLDVPGLTSGVSAVSTGWAHTCALTGGGGMKCWGWNPYGQLGNGTNTDSNLPVEVSGLASGVSAISGGYSHTCALTSSGEVKCWGDNDYGQLGNGSNTDSNVPVDVIFSFSTNTAPAAVDDTGSADEDDPTGVTVSVLDNDSDPEDDPLSVTEVTQGTGGSVAINPDDTLTYIPSPDFNGGDSFSYTVCDNGSPVLCDSSVVSITVSPVNDTPSFTLGPDIQVPEGLSAYNQPWATEISAGPSDESGQALAFLVSNDNNGLFDVQPAIGALGNLEFTPAVNATGSALVSVTLQDDGGTANGGVDSSPVQFFTIIVQPASSAGSISAGGAFACTLVDGGGVKCWGDNPYGQLGNGSNQDSNVPVDVVGLTSGASAVSAGNFHACALVNGGVKCWGQNLGGQLGNGTFTSSNVPVDVTGLTSGVITVEAGVGYTCALTSGGGVKCWGSNTYGELGDSSNTTRNLPVDVTGLTSGASQVNSGAFHTCALTNWGGIKCWGRNVFSQLGDGTTIDSNVPVDASVLASSASAVSVGNSFTCALTTGGGVKCWGYNGYGQLGNGTNTSSTTPVEVSGLASGITMVSASIGFHTCAVLSNGDLKCWGENLNGQLGDGTNTDSNLPVDVTGMAGSTSAVSTGQEFTCALTSSGGVKCWGTNTQGQLGNGSNTASNVPVDVLFNPSANTAPVATDDEGSVDEDSPTGVTVPVLTNDSDPEDDPLSITEVTQGAGGSVDINPDDTLTYIPDPDFNGGDSFSYTVCDDGAPVLCDTATVAITVNPTNDAPSFTSGADVLVLEDSGAYSAPWASGISAGPVDESGQVLTFLATNDNNVLFAVQPTIDATGNLTFTPAAGVTGSAVVSVILQDDGGTANGGVDSTLPQDFTITVQPAANSAPTVLVSPGICLSDNKANGTFNLTVGDVESPAESLTVTATSSNQALLPNANLTLAGSGSNHTLTLFAANRSSGTAVISVLVSDGTDSTTLLITLMVGTNQNETLNGTSDVDVLFGLGGTNTLNGLAGDDLLCGGSKVDTLNGGDGFDVLNGGKGNDVLNGGNEDDILLGNAGNDALTGGLGADSFNGGAGRDSATDLNTSEGDILIGSLP